MRLAQSVCGGLALVLLAGCAPHGDPGTAAAPSSSSDWRDASYAMTCDGLAPVGFTAKLVDGAATVPADVGSTPYYDTFDVRLEATATGDVDGDGAPDTVVLLQCMPQPSNGYVEEAQVFTADGRRLGVLPSPSSLPEAATLPPLYDPAGLSVHDGDVVAVMRVYGPQDSHASGPTQRVTVRWHWDGEAFERVAG